MTTHRPGHPPDAPRPDFHAQPPVMTPEEVAEAAKKIRRMIATSFQGAMADGLIDSLAAQAERVPGLEKQVGDLADKAAATFTAATETRKRLETRAEKAESERDAAREEVAVAARINQRLLMAADGVLAGAPESDAERAVVALRDRVATLETELKHVTEQRDAWKDAHEGAESRVREVVAACEQMERRYLSEAKSYNEPLRTAYRYGAGVAKALGAVARDAAPASQPRPAPAQGVEVSTIRSALEAMQHYSPHAADVRRAEAALAALSRLAPSTTPPAPAQGVAEDVETVRGALDLLEHNDVGQRTDGFAALERISARLSPTPPPGLREAVGPVVEEFRRWDAATGHLNGDWPIAVELPRSTWRSLGAAYDATPVPAPELREAVGKALPGLEQVVNFAKWQVGYDAVATLRAAYDATGGEDWAAKMQDDLRVVLTLATTGNLGTTQTPLGQRAVNAVQALREDAAKYRAAVERAKDATGLTHAAGPHSNPIDCAHWVVTGEDLHEGAPFERATLDKARVVEVLRTLRDRSRNAESRAREMGIASTRARHEGAHDMATAIAQALGLTLDTPPSGALDVRCTCGHERGMHQSAAGRCVETGCACESFRPPSGPGGAYAKRDGTRRDELVRQWEAMGPLPSSGLASDEPIQTSGPEPERLGCDVDTGDVLLHEMRQAQSRPPAGPGGGEVPAPDDGEPLSARDAALIDEAWQSHAAITPTARARIAPTPTPEVPPLTWCEGEHRWDTRDGDLPSDGRHEVKCQRCPAVAKRLRLDLRTYRIPNKPETVSHD